MLLMPLFTYSHFEILQAALDGENVICIVELVQEILHNDWSKALHLRPIVSRLYMILQRYVKCCVPVNLNLF